MTLTSLQQIAKVLGGLPIWGTFAGSLAHRAGLRYGDIILQVNGKPTPTVADYYKARQLESETMALRFFRNGVTHTITLTLQRPQPSILPRSNDELNDFTRSCAVALVSELGKYDKN